MFFFRYLFSPITFVIIISSTISSFVNFELLCISLSNRSNLAIDDFAARSRNSILYLSYTVSNTQISNNDSISYSFSFLFLFLFLLLSVVINRASFNLLRKKITNSQIPSKINMVCIFKFIT